MSDDRVFAKCAWRLIPFMGLLYLANYPQGERALRCAAASSHALRARRLVRRCDADRLRNHGAAQRIADYPTLVPQVDADGNDRGGVSSLSLLVPLGTYTGWNTRAAGHSEGDACDLTGSFIPFPKSDADARSNGDPRKAIQTRYPSVQAYDTQVDAAVRTLVSQGFMLADDEQPAVAQLKTQAHSSGLLGQ